MQYYDVYDLKGVFILRAELTIIAMIWDMGPEAIKRVRDNRANPTDIFCNKVGGQNVRLAPVMTDWKHDAMPEFTNESI